MDWRPQRGILERRLRAAVRAALDGPGLWLPGGERGGAAAHSVVAAALDSPLPLASHGAPGVRTRQLRAAAPLQPAHLRPPAAVRAGCGPVRAQRGPLGPGRGARPERVRGVPPGGDVWAQPLSTHRRAALPADARAARLLLVHAGR